MKALTPKEYRALNLTRPITDKPVGSFTQPRRDRDALASECVPVTPERKLQPVEKIERQTGPTRDNCGSWRGIGQHQRNGEHQCAVCSEFRRSKYPSRRKSA